MEKKTYLRIISVIFVCLLVVYLLAENKGEQELYSEAQKLIDSYSGDSHVLVEANELLQKILDSNPNSALAYVGLCRLTYKAGYINYSNYEEEALRKAHIYLDKALSIDNKIFDAYFYGTYLCLYEKNYQQSKEMVMKAEALDPNSAKVDLLYAQLAEAVTNYTEVERRAQAVISKATDKKILVDSYSLLSRAYSYQKRLDLSDKCYLKIIEIDPNPWSMVNYSSFLCRKGDYDKAIEYGKKALSLMDFGMGHYVLGTAYYKKGEDLYWNRKQYKRSREFFILAIQYNPDNANAYYGLGLSYCYAGYYTNDVSELKKAESVLMKAIGIDPNHKQAINELAKIRRLIEQNK